MLRCFDSGVICETHVSSAVTIRLKKIRLIPHRDNESRTLFHTQIFGFCGHQLGVAGPNGSTVFENVFQKQYCKALTSKPH